MSNFLDIDYRPVLKAACARDAAKIKAFADKWGYESTETDWKKLIDRKDIDAVDVCVPNNLHKEIALAAAANGKRILCEKPLALNPQEGEEMCRRSRRPWTGNVTEEHYPLLENIKKWGFDGAELPMFGFEEAQYRAIRRKVDAIGLECTTVTIVPPEACPIDSDPRVRAAAVDRPKEAIDTCHILNAKMMRGPYVSPVGKLVGRGRTPDEWKWAVECFQEVAPHAQQAGVTLGLEALNRFETYFVNCSVERRW